MKHGPKISLTLIDQGHCSQLALCRAVEAIADGLPHDVDPAQCLTLANALRPIIAHAQQAEEAFLFPALSGINSQWLDMPAVLERLRVEHVMDMCHAEDLMAALLAFGRGEPVASAEALGYMCRGFFETLRRHIAFERDLLLPFLR